MSIDDIKKDIVSYHFTKSESYIMINGSRIYKRLLCLDLSKNIGKNLVYYTKMDFTSNTIHNRYHPYHAADGVILTDESLGGCAKFLYKEQNYYWLSINFETDIFIASFIIVTPNCCGK